MNTLVSPRRSICRLTYSSKMIIPWKCRPDGLEAAATASMREGRSGAEAQLLRRSAMRMFCPGSPNGQSSFSTPGSNGMAQALFPLLRADGAAYTLFARPIDFVGQSRAGDYGDFVAMVDAAIGEILGSLDRGRLTDETLVIMTSDNGARWTPEEIHQFDHRANFNNRGQKSDAFEGDTAFPSSCVGRARFDAGSTSDELGCLVDLTATCADAAGVAVPSNAARRQFQSAAGNSFQTAGATDPRGGGPSLRVWNVCDSLGPMEIDFGTRLGRFHAARVRIVPKPGEPAGQLYNLVRDRQETTNVYLQNPEIVRDLTSKLERIRHSGRSRSADNRGVRCRFGERVAKLAPRKCTTAR